MLHRVLHKFLEKICYKILSQNNNFNPKGFMEINPKYFDEMMIQNNLVEHWINQLDMQIARAKVKEQMHKEGIARCNYLIQEVLPVISTAMSLLKQSMDYNAQLENKLQLQEKEKLANEGHYLIAKSKLACVSDDQKIRFKNINLMLSDSFERLRKKRNEIHNWLSHSKAIPDFVSEM